MWLVGSIAAVVGLVVVIVAMVLDRPVDDAPDPNALGTGLPRPAEVRGMAFPSSWWGGYDHRAVDTRLAELAERYEALYLAAGPSVIADAERRLSGPSAEEGSSAEELEDGGGDGTGVLDR